MGGRNGRDRSTLTRSDETNGEYQIKEKIK